MSRLCQQNNRAFRILFLSYTSNPSPFVLVVSSAGLVILDNLVCKESLGLLGHRVVTVGTESKVNRAAQGRLDPRDLQELLVSMERMVPKENPECRALPPKRGSAGESRTSGIPWTPGVMSYKNC